jgi:hypothetical protein
MARYDGGREFRRMARAYGAAAEELRTTKDPEIARQMRDQIRMVERWNDKLVDEIMREKK